MDSATLVQKLWNYCNGPGLGRSLARSPAREHAGARVKPRPTLRDDGMSYGDYGEQLTYRLFLKMADERSKPPYNQPSPIPAKYAWPALLAKDGDDLFDHYRHTLDELGKGKGTLALIVDGRGREGRRLRGAAGEERRIFASRTRNPAPASTSRRAPMICHMFSKRLHLLPN